MVWLGSENTALLASTKEYLEPNFGDKVAYQYDITNIVDCFIIGHMPTHQYEELATP
jgi:hypothetical protein